MRSISGRNAPNQSMAPAGGGGQQLLVGADLGKADAVDLQVLRVPIMRVAALLIDLRGEAAHLGHRGRSPTGLSLVKVTGSATLLQICSGTIGTRTISNAILVFTALQGEGNRVRVGRLDRGNPVPDVLGVELAMLVQHVEGKDDVARAETAGRPTIRRHRAGGSSASADCRNNYSRSPAGSWACRHASN